VTNHVVRTFKPRRRRVSATRAELIERVGATHLVAETGPVLELRALFGRDAPVVLEVGFGYGDATVAMAGAQPDIDAIAVDVHTPGVAGVLEAVERDQLDNLRVVHGDAIVFLDRLPPASLAGVRIFFPDPWPKVRQRHRRLVRPDLVARFVEKLRPGGVLHLATDVADYAAQMRSVCTDADGLAAATDVPWRAATRYELKGHDAGRRSTDLAFRRTA
jgi:tRNA (guanine-N7-)-methyltransferase